MMDKFCRFFQPGSLLLVGFIAMFQLGCADPDDPGEPEEERVSCVTQRAAAMKLVYSERLVPEGGAPSAVGGSEVTDTAGGRSGPGRLPPRR